MFYVYFAQKHLTDHFKVGRTYCLYDRLEQLRISTKARVHLHSVLRTHNRWAEKVFHKILAPRQIVGEWFRLEYRESERVIDYFLEHEELLTNTYQQWSTTPVWQREGMTFTFSPKWIVLNQRKTA